MRAFAITKSEEILALRLASALVWGWDLLPRATQARLLRHASMDNETKDGKLSRAMIDFIERHKERDAGRLTGKP
jgi:hypothetical protein